MPAITNGATRTVAGVGKPEEKEPAGGCAETVQRALWGLRPGAAHRGGRFPSCNGLDGDPAVGGPHAEVARSKARRRDCVAPAEHQQRASRADCRPAVQEIVAGNALKVNHDVSNRKTSWGGDDRCVGVSPRWNLSMICKREPQQGHAGRLPLSSEAATASEAVVPPSSLAAAAASNVRARSMFAARVPVASRP